ncbi:MAG: alpha/beta fold hydrolase [Gemmatimonadaceae bacterium]|nr:alpha/beta fold hydrolase [Gemmatimonadaceae bacterium]
MTLRQVRDTRLRVEDTGGDGPPVVFSHGVLWSTALFAPQVAALRGTYRCVSYDHRGQGRSDDTSARTIPIEQVYEDQVALIESLGAGPVHLVGLSMGGFAAMRVAARRPELLRSLTLLETTCTAETVINLPRYWGLNMTAAIFGVGSVIGPVMQSLVGRTVLQDPARASDVAGWRAALAGNRRTIVRAMRGVMWRKSVTHEMPQIVTPTLIIVGEEDVATPPAKAEQLHALIRGSTLVRIARAGHSATLEAPAAVNEAMASFLSSLR